MPYVLYKSNGTKFATIEDGSLNLDTSLTFVGKNYSGYGQVLNQDLLKMLENFASTTQPLTPMTGQLWYDLATKKIKIYNGTLFSSLSKLEYTSTTPLTPALGDLWWDSSKSQLKIFNGTNFVLSTTASASTTTDESGRIVAVIPAKILGDDDAEYNVLEHIIENVVVAVVSSYSFTVHADDPLYGIYSVITPGITLRGANAVTGSSTSTGYTLWGTAADSLRLNNIAAEDYALKTDLPAVATSISVTTLTATTVNAAFIQSIGTGVIKGHWLLDSTATLESSYADVAERYSADMEYCEGTVVVIGGVHDVTTTLNRADTAVAGVVSKKYSHLLNATAGPDSTHPALALVGRIPCLVVGPVSKGDLLVTSNYAGHAESWKLGDSPNAVIGKALASIDSAFGMIEIKV